MSRYHWRHGDGEVLELRVPTHKSLLLSCRDSPRLIHHAHRIIGQAEIGKGGIVHYCVHRELTASFAVTFDWRDTRYRGSMVGKTCTPGRYLFVLTAPHTRNLRVSLWLGRAILLRSALFCPPPRSGREVRRGDHDQCVKFNTPVSMEMQLCSVRVRREEWRY